jgi:hypothetical protein
MNLLLPPLPLPSLDGCNKELEAHLIILLMIKFSEELTWNFTLIRATSHMRLKPRDL